VPLGDDASQQLLLTTPRRYRFVALAAADSARKETVGTGSV
jgi:hypothetical protein